MFGFTTQMLRAHDEGSADKGYLVPPQVVAEAFQLRQAGPPVQRQSDSAQILTGAASTTLTSWRGHSVAAAVRDGVTV